MVWCRVLARSHRHNHPLTSVMTVAVAMTLKKLYGRYVAATITETSYVTMCSVFLGLMEYLSVISNPTPNPNPTPTPTPTPTPNPTPTPTQVPLRHLRAQARPLLL